METDPFTQMARDAKREADRFYYLRRVSMNLRPDEKTNWHFRLHLAQMYHYHIANVGLPDEDRSV